MEYYIVIAVILLVFLSFANGANDVSKRIARLARAEVTSIHKRLCGERCGRLLQWVWDYRMDYT
jgi:hypothetical protein